MGRLVKVGLDYYPIDTHMFSSRLIKRLLRNYGTDAIALYTIIHCDIYTEGYSVLVDDDYLFDISDRIHIDERRIIEIIKEMIALGIFDSKEYEEKRILTSDDIKSLYIFVKNKKWRSVNFPFIGKIGDKKDKKEVSADKNEEAVKGAKTGNKSENDGVIRTKDVITDMETVINDPKTAEVGEKKTKNGENGAQRKEKKKKENEIKVNQTIPNTRNGRKKTKNNDIDEFEKDELAKDEWKRIRQQLLLVQDFDSIREKLLNNEDWCASVVRISGKGVGIINEIPEAMRKFEDHIVSTGDKATVLREHEYAKRFVNWWRCMQFRSAERINSNNLKAQEEPKDECRADKMFAAGKRAAMMALEMMNNNE